MTVIKLDDLYKMVAHIYSEQNLARTPTTTFAHFTEVCGMLTIHCRSKKREGVTVTDVLCKALGWYFPLLAKLKVRSVEELIYRKFPYACPYCRLAPHRDAECKLVKGTGSTVDHIALQETYVKNQSIRPKSLNEWQKMFQEIYPRETDDRNRSIIGLFEELGELAEAIRVFEKYPKYFVGEAADTFSYLMGVANEHSLRLMQEKEEHFSFEEEFLRRYPGLCIQCGARICACPTVPEATVGRMAKELDIGENETLFLNGPQNFAFEGRQVAHAVLERGGGHSGVIAGFPFDRGDANRALVSLCLRIAGAIQKDRPEFAERLRAEAIQIGASATYAGSPKEPFDVHELIEEIRQIWRELDKNFKSEITSRDDILGDLGGVLATFHVLFVGCSPSDEIGLRVSGELRTIRESLKIAEKGNKIDLHELPAATIDDLRRELLSQSYEIVHFAGHADKDTLVFESPDG